MEGLMNSNDSDRVLEALTSLFVGSHVTYYNPIYSPISFVAYCEKQRQRSFSIIIVVTFVLILTRIFVFIQYILLSVFSFTVIFIPY